MPCDWKKYPKDWKRIRDEVLLRAEYRCECEGECGLHRTIPGPRRCIEIHGQVARWAAGKVVLTVAHINHDTTDNRPENLKAMCQRCHLRYDSELHAKNSAATRERKRAEGTLTLL